jgi:8-oxo-dGTP pyrophosphatase MutT (NUDIX family)
VITHRPAGGYAVEVAVPAATKKKAEELALAAVKELLERIGLEAEIKIAPTK